MKKFLLRTCCFAIPILVLGIFIELTYTRIPNDYSNKRKFLESKMKDVKILVLGSSLTWRGINPSFFSEPAYNASFSGQSLKYDYLLLNKYIDSCKSLSSLILCVSYGDFRNTTEKLFPTRLIFYSKYFNLGNSHELFIANRRGEALLSDVTKYYFNGKNSIESDSLGFKPSEEIVNYEFEKNGKRLAKFLTTDSNSEIDENLNYLNLIAETCSTYHVKLYLITPPFSEALRLNLNVNQQTEMEKLCDSTVQAGENRYYLNYLNDSSFTRTDFFNTNHLNNKGAEKLTRKIDSIIKMK